MSRSSVAIIGLGPRGLAVFERICAHLDALPIGELLVLHLIDSNECGQGAHPATQRETLLINTVAGQVTMFADPTVEMAGPQVEGPTLAAWARDQGYRRVGERFARIGGTVGAAIDDNDYLPRSLLGEYLSWCFDKIASAHTGRLELNFHRHDAVDVETSGALNRIRLASGFVIDCDYVFVATGHGRNRPSLDDSAVADFVRTNSLRRPTLLYFPSAYPLSHLSRVPPKARVAIAGMGLSAHDVISECTTGRGGTFLPSSSGLRYVSSGREPVMYLYSRQGLPFSARGRNQKGNSGQYKARFFTVEAVLSLQRAAAARQTKPDFTDDMWPLILKEMAYVHECTRRGVWREPAGYVPDSHDERAVAAMLRPDLGRVSSLQDFRDAVYRYVEADLEHAEIGNVDDPLKAASDVLRDVRDTLRLAIDRRACSPSSHRNMMECFVPIMNRLAVGPPRSRNQQLLALIDAGIVVIGGGPGASCGPRLDSGCFSIHSRFAESEVDLPVDVLIRARIEPFLPERDSSLLVGNLLRRGTIRPFFNGDYHPGGIDIDEDDHPIDRRGQSHSRIWAMGNLAEGPNFYTYVLPRPGVNSRFIRDADKRVGEMIGAIGSDRLIQRNRAA